MSAFLGPLVTAAIAGRIGISPTLLIFFTLLGFGVIGPAFSRSGTGIMVLVRLLWRPARPRVHYGGACPGNGVRRGWPRMMRVTIPQTPAGAAVGGLAFPYLFEVSGYGNLFLLGGAAMFLGAIVTLPRRVP